MDWYVRTFLKAALAWLTLGVTLGVAMAAHPVWTIYRTIHMHMVLLGFVTMMIYGVAYHVLPRFSGHPLWSPRLAVVHCWSAQVGLALMVIGLALRFEPGLSGTVATVVLSVGGTLSALGAYSFALNLWRTIDGAGMIGKAAATNARKPFQAGAAALPVLTPSAGATASRPS